MAYISNLVFLEFDKIAGCRVEAEVLKPALALSGRHQPVRDGFRIVGARPLSALKAIALGRGALIQGIVPFSIQQEGQLLKTGRNEYAVDLVDDAILGLEVHLIAIEGRLPVVKDHRVPVL